MAIKAPMKVHPVMNEAQIRLSRAVDAALHIAETRGLEDLSRVKDMVDDDINPHLIAQRIIKRYKVAQQIRDLAIQLDCDC
jgi:hypothetical protein